MTLLTWLRLLLFLNRQQQIHFTVIQILIILGYNKQFSSPKVTFGIGLSETHGEPAMAIMDTCTLKWAITCVVSIKVL